jgi:hypothetical protein
MSGQRCAPRKSAGVSSCRTEQGDPMHRVRHPPPTPSTRPCSGPFASQTRCRAACYGASAPATCPGTRLIAGRKIPWRLSRHQKYRHRERLRHVDTVVSTLDTALRRMGQSMKKVERWKLEMPTEEEMLPKDKYTVFDRKVKRYRKGIHSKLLCYYVWMSADSAQRCRSGRGSASASTRLVSRRRRSGCGSGYARFISSPNGLSRVLDYPKFTRPAMLTSFLCSCL